MFIILLSSHFDAANMAITVVSLHEEVLTLNSITEKTKVHCQARNVAGSSMTHVSTIDIIKGKESYCTFCLLISFISNNDNAILFLELGDITSILSQN